MSKRKRITPEQIMALYRETGMPLVDQILAGQIVASDATEEEQEALFLMLNCARDFASDDPEVWAQGEALLGKLRAAWEARQQGASDAAALEATARRASDAASPDVHLAVVALQYSGLAAFHHVLRRRLTKN